MLSESVVRAAVVRYVREHRGDAAAMEEVRDQQAIGFAWMPELYELLGEYESDRARYRTLDAFMPRIVEYYRGLAPRIGSMVEEYGARRPRVVGSTIPPDSVVASNVRVLEFRFDRAMRQGYSMRAVPGKRELHPEVAGDPSWDASRTTLRIPVNLQPGRSYAFVLGGSAAIRSAEGIPMLPLTVEFTTP